MPWSNQGGGWKSGGGPWGQGPQNSGSGGPQQPDLEEILKRSQDKIKRAMPGGGGISGAFMFLIVLVGLAVLAFFGFTVRVNPDELGIVTRFGEYKRQLSPGLNFRFPYPVEQVYLPKVNFTNRVEIGMRGANDTRFGQDVAREVPEESLMLTGDGNIVKVQFSVQWRIKDASDFLFKIANPENSVKEVAESAMREVVGKNQLDFILTERFEQNQDAVRELMQKTLDGYNSGILITNVFLRKPDAPDQVIDAFNDVEAAKQDRQRLVREAEAYQNRVVPEARGFASQIVQQAEAYKNRVVAESKGQADRFSKIYSEYSKAPEVTRQRMFLETMERVFGKMDKIIVDSKGGSGVVPYLPLDQLTRQKNTGGGR